MSSSPTNDETREALVVALEREGFRLDVQRELRPGPDIVATKPGEDPIFIEVIGYKSSGSDKRARDFWRAFSGALARIGCQSATKAAIAIPSEAGVGMPERARGLGEAWTRLGNAFPELKIWLVDVFAKTYRSTEWNDWLPRG